MPYATLSLEGQCALITGASSGIGKAVAFRLVEEGISRLVLIARRKERLAVIQQELLALRNGTGKSAGPGGGDVRVHVIGMDLGANMDEVARLPDVLPEEYRDVDIVVNNAGLALGKDAVYDNSVANVIGMVNVNVSGAFVLASAFLQRMKQRNTGHLVNIGSTAGHNPYAGGSVYCGTKAALLAFSDAARHDLVNSAVRITTLSPGAVQTEFSVVRFNGDQSKAEAVYDRLVPMNADDIADQIHYVVTRPKHVQIATLISVATAQADASTIARGVSLEPVAKNQ
ncbi:NADP-dependent 3-hydroxy acid dehydrogenase [Porphyridium purpureum]|uniref:NADP-dependent 3-hydroxy acid dehydrogenase n=1 Tax=Porphyridium purpureum TaxID=35688 RepID=A0A5J4Z2L9_PORPP|nr:NADP-dependent 3-hydroxy acid dehydrogenase [Porphyridium purpureum]|eukprot:POR7390..scf208_2